MSAGNQTTLRFLPGTTFSVPAGWVNELDNGLQFGLYPDTAANKSEYELTRQIAQNVLMTSLVANNMFAICDATGLFQGSTAAEVIDGIVANEALSTTEPVDVTIGGLSGRQVDVRLDPAWTGSCVVVSEDDPPTRDYGGGNRFIMLDRPGQGPIGIAIGSMHSADFEAFLAEAMPIVESFQFDLGPQASPS
jgi:hypothetical protein